MLDNKQLENFRGEVRRAVEPRRRGRGTEREQTAEMVQGKRVRFVEEEEGRAQSTDEQDVMSGLEEVRTGRGSARLVRGRDERRLTNKTSGKGRGQGNGGKGEHGRKEGFSSKGLQQSRKMIKGEEAGGK